MSSFLAYSKYKLLTTSTSTESTRVFGRRAETGVTSNPCMKMLSASVENTSGDPGHRNFAFCWSGYPEEIGCRYTSAVSSDAIFVTCPAYQAPPEKATATHSLRCLNLKQDGSAGWVSPSSSSDDEGQSLCSGGGATGASGARSTCSRMLS